MAELTIFGALRNAATSQKALTPVSNWRGGWRTIHEPFAGAWQRNDELKVGDLTCYPALYACLNRISQDIGKLPFLLKREDDNGIWQTVENTAYSPVLRKPNGYQTAQQFRESWILSKLIHGNTYVLKQRDNRGVVTSLYVLDPCRVIPMVSDAGNVFYQINYPSAQNLLPQSYPAEQLTVPASEIIHDRINCFHHHLIGVPPLCAAYWPAVKNLKILKSSAEFFGNNAQPGGILTAPAGMGPEDAEAIKAYWAENYTGANAGKIAVIGADMKFTAFAMKSADSQLVEQMRYSDEQICQPFGVPPFKIGIGAIPAGLGVDAINQLYYADALQGHIESMENLLDEGLRISRPEGVELDLWPLLRMDLGKQADVMVKLTGGGIATPNEGRKEFGYAPLSGGDTVYMQQQDFPLDQVRKNKIVEAEQNPAPPPAPEPEPDPEAEAERDETRRMAAELYTLKAFDAARIEATR
ncbi:phage portal protein [Luteimonas saliphila]|uniref:phage portal protein n=1 Tax=Luteimonas saliphila TaxID=2804919 RepID=UPI00192D86BE|nr:phage portal protein [Luteimonas saliphila]